jgi:hypothetical protein
MRNASKNISAGLLALTVLLGGGTAEQLVESPTTVADASRFEIEVAEDGTRFAFDESPVFDDGYPSYGNGFVTQGYIYPAGTLGTSNGVNPDGSPEFPDQVIGEWTCYGYFVGDGAHTEQGAWVVTTQVFEFDSEAVGGETLVTVGPETPADAGPATRAVVGGTGRFGHVSGEVEQVTLGHNTSEGVNATFTFALDGAGEKTVQAPEPPLLRSRRVI